MQRFQVDAERAGRRGAVHPAQHRRDPGPRTGWRTSRRTPYTATTDAEPGALRNDAETTANIRIIDPALVTESFAQLQQIKQYYQFDPRLDVDRYTIDGKTQDTVIGVRELDSPSSAAAQQLVQQHRRLHARLRRRRRVRQPALRRRPAGVPRVRHPEHRRPRQVRAARLLRRELAAVLDRRRARRTPSRSSWTTRPATRRTARTPPRPITGNGGPKLDNIFKKLIFAIKFQSEQIFLSDAVNDKSQILYDRDPKDRVQKVAPYLTLDSDAYPAVVDGKVVWIVDGYTTSDTLPVLEHRAAAAARSPTPTRRRRRSRSTTSTTSATR